MARILRAANGSYEHFTEERTLETYNANGYVLSVTNRQGIGWTFSYVGNYLQTVTHTSGRSVQFEWSAAGDPSTVKRLVKVTDPAGKPYEYAYDLSAFGSGQHRLKSATLPGTPTTLVEYHYEKAGLPGALTGVSYNHVRYSTFDYDSEGRATLSQHHGPAGDVDKYVFSYTGSSSTPTHPPPMPPPPGGVCDEPFSVLCDLPPVPQPIEHREEREQRARIAAEEIALLSQPLAMTQVTETNPLGKQTIYTLTDGRITKTDGQASTHCAGSLHQRGYDANGFPALLKDARNNDTTLVFDGRGQLQFRTEAPGKPVERTTEYDWDAANNRLNYVKVQGDHQQTFEWWPESAGGSKHRLKSITTKNLSSHGTLNQTHVTGYAYTFHGNGLVATITEDGPLTGTGDAIQYTYNDKGDLTEIRNSLNHTVTYSLHNQRGQPGRIVGANGEKVEVDYDDRGRVWKMRTFHNNVSKETTYTYAASGLLQSVATPDGVTESYGYDSARRLKTITRNDAAGTTFHEQFHDAASHVTKTETWHIVSGQTPILIQRAYSDYDELGRVIARRGNHDQNTGYCYDGNGNLSHILRLGGISASNAYCKSLHGGAARRCRPRSRKPCSSMTSATA